MLLVLNGGGIKGRGKGEEEEGVMVTGGGCGSVEGVVTRLLGGEEK